MAPFTQIEAAGTMMAEPMEQLSQSRYETRLHILRRGRGRH